jgi:tight adherence protein C
MSIAKVLSLCIPLSVAMLVTYLTSMSIQWTASIALGLGIAGMIGPSFVLDRIKRQRQLRIRRAIPDALDVLSICLEAGMSLPAALSKVSQELTGAHPGLATELAIVNRETLLGRSVGESMRALADRFDIEELRSMSSVMVQAEKYGSSLVDAMEVFAATMRQKRMFIAEAHAQQSVAKILIPTVLCILPALFLVTLGPAVIMIMRGLAKT